MRSWKRLSLWLNLSAFLFLLIGLGVVYCLPQELTYLGWSPIMGKVVLLQLISFILLLGSFQVWLGRFWRRASLGASFVVLGEATMMALLLPA